MTTINNTRTPVQTTQPTQPAATPLAAPVDAAPLGDAQEQQKAATFDRSAKRTSLFASPSANGGGDSRVVLPAGGGTGEVNNHEAIDGHSKKEGDFTEPRTVSGKALFFTPDGARALDAWVARADELSAPLRAEEDPAFWERFFGGDLFAGLEQHTGKTK